MEPGAMGATRGDWGRTPAAPPWFAKFASKFVLDILPAALASVIGGFLFTQYHFAQAVPAPAAQGVPASAEMVAMVRDEHAQIMSYLKAQLAAEQNRDRAEDAATARAVAEARAQAEAKVAAASAASAGPATTVRHVAAAPSKARVPAKPPVAMAAAHAPLVIAEAQPMAVDTAPPRDQNSLIARTLDIKDHVVAATRHVVGAIGSAFDSLGDSIGGAVSGRQFRSS